MFSSYENPGQELRPCTRVRLALLAEPPVRSLRSQTFPRKVSRAKLSDSAVGVPTFRARNWLLTSVRGHGPPVIPCARRSTAFILFA
jgi:hypothetical protein